MNADFILQALRRKYPAAAIVPELTIDDDAVPDDRALRHEFRHTRRIDALMFQSLVRTAIEIKVSAADFARDTYWKRRAWQSVTHRFVYVVPHDLDVMSPHGCGLWKVHEDGSIVVAKKAIVSKTPEPIPQMVIQRLAYRAGAAGRGRVGRVADGWVTPQVSTLRGKTSRLGLTWCTNEGKMYT